ncbi:unnamed protein product [Prunus armeniaca]
MRSEHTHALVTSRGSQWDKNAPQLQCPRAATRAGNAWVFKAIIHRRKNNKSRLKTPTLESPLEIRPKSNSKIRHPTLKIDAILPNHQLDNAEGMNFHTLIAKNGGRTTENEAGKVSGETELFSSIFRRNLDGWRRDLAGVCRGRRPDHFGTGPVDFGGRTRARPAKTWPAVSAVANQRRERGTRGRERPTTCLRTHLAVLYGTVHPEFPNSFRGDKFGVGVLQRLLGYEYSLIRCLTSTNKSKAKLNDMLKSNPYPRAQELMFIYAPLSSSTFLEDTSI